MQKGSLNRWRLLGIDLIDVGYVTLALLGRNIHGATDGLMEKGPSLDLTRLWRMKLGC